MPRESKQKRFLRELRSLLNKRLLEKAIREMEEESDEEEDLKDALLANIARNANERGYLFRQSKYREEERNDLYKTNMCLQEVPYFCICA
jgi:transcriptional regulator of heat shock response